MNITIYNTCNVNNNKTNKITISTQILKHRAISAAGSDGYNGRARDCELWRYSVDRWGIYLYCCRIWCKLFHADWLGWRSAYLHVPSAWWADYWFILLVYLMLYFWSNVLKVVSNLFLFYVFLKFCGNLESSITACDSNVYQLQHMKQAIQAKFEAWWFWPLSMHHSRIFSSECMWQPQLQSQRLKRNSTP